MIRDEDLRAIRDNAGAAVALTMAIIVAVLVIIRLL